MSGRPSLTPGQAAALGRRLNRAEDLVAELQRAGAGGETLAAIAETIAALREQTGARAARLELDRARAAAIELADLALQLRPVLEEHAPLGSGLDAFVAETERLCGLAFRLLDEVEAASAARRAYGRPDRK